ncbi:hypothetical protein LINGRAHAP2_LOCUS9031 [Linum grandiflorum]
MNSPTVIFSDCLSLVRFLNGNRAFFHWEGSALTSTILRVLLDNLQILIKFIPRENNSKADWVARNAYAGTLPENWISLLPSKGL